MHMPICEISKFCIYVILGYIVWQGFLIKRLTQVVTIDILKKYHITTVSVAAVPLCLHCYTLSPCCLLMP